MEVGDLVTLKRELNADPIWHCHGVGLIIDFYYNDTDLTEYFCVSFKDDWTWWASYELVLINACKKSI